MYTDVVIQRVNFIRIRLLSRIYSPRFLILSVQPLGGGHNGQYGEAPPKRATFFRLEVYKSLGISQAEVQKRAGKSVILVLKGTFKTFRTDALNGDSFKYFKGFLR